MVTIPEVDLLERMADLTEADPVDILRRPSLARLTMQMSAQVREACTAYLRLAEQCLAKPDAPSRLSESAKSTVDLIVRALVSSCASTGRKSSVRRQRRLVANALEYCDHRANQPIDVRKLCDEAHSRHKRPLRFAFQAT
jgi:hypothetical protein